MEAVQFKKDIVNGIIQLIKKIWQPIAAFYILYYVVAKLVSFSIIKLLGYESTTDLLNEYMSYISDTDELMDWLTEKMELVMQPQVLVVFILAYLFQFLMMNWIYFYGFKVVDATVKSVDSVVSVALKQSLTIRLLGFIGVGIGTFILMFASFALASVLSFMVSPFLLILLFPLVLLLNVRLWMAFANYALSPVSMGESFEVSFHYITWQRAAKMLGVGFVFMIGLAFVQLILQQIVLLIGIENVAGLILSNVVGFIMGAFTMCVGVAAFSALFYRYAEVDEANDEMEIVDHLVE
jgi:hypothetical protein